MVAEQDHLVALSFLYSYPPNFKYFPLAITTINSYPLYLKFLPSLPQTLAISPPNSHSFYLKHLSFLADICGQGNQEGDGLRIMMRPQGINGHW